jgi:hypothetical protein
MIKKGVYLINLDSKMQFQFRIFWYLFRGLALFKSDCHSFQVFIRAQFIKFARGGVLDGTSIVLKLHFFHAFNSIIDRFNFYFYLSHRETLINKFHQIFGSHVIRLPNNPLSDLLKILLRRILNRR